MENGLCAVEGGPGGRLICSRLRRRPRYHAKVPRPRKRPAEAKQVVKCDFFFIFQFHFLQKYIFIFEIYRNIPRPPCKKFYEKFTPRSLEDRSPGSGTLVWRVPEGRAPSQQPARVHRGHGRAPRPARCRAAGHLGARAGYLDAWISEVRRVGWVHREAPDTYMAWCHPSVFRARLLSWGVTADDLVGFLLLTRAYTNYVYRCHRDLPLRMLLIFLVEKDSQ